MFKHEEITIKISPIKNPEENCAKKYCNNVGDFKVVINNHTDNTSFDSYELCSAHILTEIINFWAGVY